MGLLSSLLRLLLIGLLFAALSRLFARVFRGHPQRRVPPQPESVPERLVQDPVCGLCLPERQALSARSGTRQVHFCSESCRNAYLAKAG
ncbi:MAG: hypothetical protein JSV80_07225 [Acidobacteriota bacterium]|nr:MAG: hypothetical protein JSV80_07225 [Acidobacteriota bacterium]